MRIYLDNCCFNRPFDNQSQIRIRIESEAKLFIQAKVLDKEMEIVWSYILEYENEHNPFEERRNAIRNWKQYAAVNIYETNEIIRMAENFTENNINPKDALHIACAIAGESEYFLTTDDLLLKKKSQIKQIYILNTIEFIQLITKS